MSKFTYFDVETPNRRNDRICSMGIIHVDNGVTVHEGVYLVNPEVSFDAFNIDLHGISPEMVAGQPTLKEWWPEIEKYFIDSVIVAHNATFDLGVLSKTIAHYRLGTYQFEYLCTLEKARRHLNYKRNSLDYLCSTFGVLMDRHHEALSDAKACQGLFYIFVERFGLEDDEIRTYWMR